MLGSIIRHELRVLSADRTLWIALLAFLGLVGYGTYNGASRAAAEADILASVAAAEVNRFEILRERLQRIEAGVEARGEPFRDPTRAGAMGRQLAERRPHLPPAPLAALSIGQSDLLPSVVPVTTRTGYGMPGREEIANPLHLLTGRLDLAFVILFLLPLLVLAISFDMLSRERESGIMGLLLSQPVRLGTLLAGKLAARAAIVFAVAIPLPLVVLSVRGVDLLAPANLSGLMLWLALVTAYTGFWLSLAAVANVVGGGSARQAVGLAAGWLFLAIVVPSALTIGGRILYPVPSRAEMIGAEREAARIAQAEGSALLAQNYEDHPEFAPADVDIDDVMTLAYAVEESVGELMEPVRRHYDEQIAAQQRLVGNLRVLSPVLLAQGALDDLAGTGDHRHAAFLQQVESFRLEFHDYFRPLIYLQEPFTSDQVASIPAWIYREETPRDRDGRIGRALAGILLPTFLLSFVAFRSTPRFVRGS
jgi:ABC-2 type transport system permease protein